MFKLDKNDDFKLNKQELEAPFNKIIYDIYYEQALSNPMAWKKQNEVRSTEKRATLYDFVNTKGKGVTQEEFKGLITSMDFDYDGLVELDELITWFDQNDNLISFKDKVEIMKALRRLEKRTVAPKEVMIDGYVYYFSNADQMDNHENAMA